MIRKVRTGDELMQLWHRALRFARKRTSDRGVAEEVASEAIVRLLDHPPEELLDEWTFLCRQVVQLSERSRAHSRRARELDEEDVELGSHDPGAPSSVVHGLWVEEFLRIVREEAERLPEPDRRVVVAHLFEEMTFLGKACERHARLSSALDTTIDRTRHQLSRGLIRLREQLERRLRRAQPDGAQGSFLVLVPLMPRLLGRQALAPAWRRPSLLKSSLVPAAAGLGLLVAVTASVALATRGPVSVPSSLEPREQIATHSDSPGPTLPPAVPASSDVARPSSIPMTRMTLARKRPARPLDGLREDFSATPVQVIAPRCDEGTVLPLGDTDWRVRNLREASCVPTENVNVVAIQADGLRVAADTNDAHGGYVGVHLDLPLRPLGWELTVRVTVAHVEDPYNRPVPQCLTSHELDPELRDESLGWSTGNDGERGQVLALNSPGAVVPTSYIVEPGIEHTIELTSLRDGAELRAWPTHTDTRPAAPLAVGASLGELERILFTGPNWKTFDYRVHGVAMRMLSGASYGRAAPNSAGRGARLAAWVEGAAPTEADPIELVVSGLPPLAFGSFVAGEAADRAPFGHGDLLVGGARRTFPLVRADSTGRAVLRLDPHAAASLGEEVFCQFLYADPALGGARNASQGVRLVRPR